MNLQQVLLVVRDAVNYIEANSMFANGTVDFNSANKDAGLVAAVEASLKKNGFVIPKKVDSIIEMLPFLMGVIS